MVRKNSSLFRLLAIDDDKDCCDLIIRQALKCGFEAFTASDKANIEEAVEHFAPHVITLDLCMQGSDALETVWTLSRTRFSGYLIIISGQDDPIRMQAAELAAANGFKVSAQMAKPMQLATFRGLLTLIRAAHLEASDAISASPETQMARGLAKPHRNERSNRA